MPQRVDNLLQRVHNAAIRLGVAQHLAHRRLVAGVIGFFVNCGQHIEVLHVGDVGQFLVAIQSVLLGGHVQFAGGVQ